MTADMLVLTDPTLAAETSVRHGYFTRVGGVSDGMFAGLNIGIGSADEKHRVQENRAKAMAWLGQPSTALTTLYQVHSADVVTVDAPLTDDSRPDADGAVTNRPGIALGIATADCAPILFADGKSGVIGACHAGWQGAVGGVIGNTVDAMERLGADRDAITAVLGPCIHQVSYEVGPEFRERFVAQGSANDRFFVASDRDGHFRFDLPAYVLARIADTGVARIGHVAEDTYADPARFYSYRRATHRDERNAAGKIDYGRLLSAIVLEG